MGEDAANSTKTPEEHLKDFLLDTAGTNWKEALRPYTGVNVFRVLGLENYEIRHSKMLGWLFDPNQNHGLREEFLREFIFALCELERKNKHGRIDVLNCLSLDFDDVTVTLETDNNIDILIDFKKSKTVICIENKINADEHSSPPEYKSQLDKYKAHIESEFKKYRHVFVFLTPDGRDAKIAESKASWISVGYSVVLSVLKKLIDNRRDKLSGEAQLLIKNYEELIRRDIVGDEKLQDLCEEVYKNHRAAIDILIKNYPGIMKFIKYMLDKEFGDRIKDVTLNGKNEILFKTENLSKAFNGLYNEKVYYRLSSDKKEYKIEYKIELYAILNPDDKQISDKILNRFDKFRLNFPKIRNSNNSSDKKRYSKIYPIPYKTKKDSLDKLLETTQRVLNKLLQIDANINVDEIIKKYHI
jgi:hypothetical protein